MEWMRDEYLDYMSGRDTERPMLVELFGPLVGLEDEWRVQGASEAEVELTAFGFDHVRRTGVEVATGFWPSVEEVVLEDTDETRIVLDGMGRRMKLSKGKATIALPLDFPVKTEADWARIKSHYRFDDARFADEWADRVRAARADGALVVAHIVGGYDEIRELMGDEEACVSFYTQPDLIRDMLGTFGELNHEILSRVVAEVTVDQLSVHEDFAGKSGPLVGGIDKFAPRTSREAIDAELAYKLQPLMREGGVVFGLDHRIPNGTPIDLYRYYVKRARDILGLEPDPEPGWARMAF